MSRSLAAVTALYGVTPADLTPLGAFESDVYEFTGSRGPSILKVIVPEHRSVEQVEAEVDWLLALREAGVPVATPIKTLDGTWVERVDDPERVVVAFARSPGVVTKPADWTENRLESWGALLGDLQAHSRGWLPPGPRRRQLHEQTYLSDFEAVVTDDPAFVRGAGELAKRIAPLLVDGPDSGLIHADLHHGNLLLEEERWTAIDFDDSSYGPYVFDLAMPLYYAVRSQRERPSKEAADAFLEPFMRGFRTRAPEPAGGAEAIALCLEYRQAELVMALRTKLPPGKWDDQLRKLERELRSNVAERRPVVEIDTLRRWFDAT